MGLTFRHLAAGGGAVAAMAVLGIQAATAQSSGLLPGASTTPCSEGLVTVDYDVAYSPALGGYAVTAAHVEGLDPGCVSNVTVTLTGRNGLPVAELSSPVHTPSVTVPVPSGRAVRAEVVEAVSVAVSG